MGGQDTNKVLAVSRIMVAWQPVGMAMGAYDMAVRYASQRHQFGAPLAGFQLTQDRLAKMLASIQVPFPLPPGPSHPPDEWLVLLHQLYIFQVYIFQTSRDISPIS